MERKTKNQVIIDKINDGIKFGLYEGGKVCFFDDGTHVSYSELWTVLRIMNNLEIGHKRTLFELCPETYRGVFPFKFSRNILINKIRSYLFQPVRSTQV